MRLLRKTMRDNILITLILLLLSGIQLYYFLKQEIIEEMREQLEYQVNDIHESLTEGHTVKSPLVTVSRVGDKLLESANFGDTLLVDPVNKKIKDYYYLNSVKKNVTGNYRVTVMTPHIGWRRYSRAIFFQLSLTALSLTLLNVLVSHFSNKKSWRSFFNNLASLKRFSVGSSERLRLEDSDVTEFVELKDSLQDLADRSQKEYQALREFTENAAHEMQTPLGIIQSKLDRMSQTAVTEEMSMYIVQAKSGVQRLKRLNRSLLLLAKLDNNAYPDKSDIRMDELLQKQLDALEELFTSRNISLEVSVQPLLIHANPYLAEILIANLLSNTLRYTPQDNPIDISIRGNVLRVINPGPPLGFPEQFLFQRFRKGAQHTETTGLGLSIVDQICQLNGWKINYSYASGRHEFAVEF